jgi:hypothetical protein
MISITNNSSYKCIEKCDCILYSAKSNYNAKNENNAKFIITPEEDVSKINFYGKNKALVNISIYSPSIHYFPNATSVDGEMILEFKDNAAICIPFGKSGPNTHGSNLLASIITICNNQLTDSSSATRNIPEFSLVDLIPINKPFQTYDALPWRIIVFSYNSSIYLNDTACKNLANLLKNKPTIPEYCYQKNVNIYTVGKNTPVSQFTNQDGISNGNVGDDIYIDCSPTGQSDEEEVLINKTNSNADSSFEITKNISSSKLFQAMMFGILIICVLMALYGLTSAFSGKNHFIKQIRQSAVAP